MDQLADLTESERILSARVAISSPKLVQRIVSVDARGTVVTFKYFDAGDPRPVWFMAVLQGFASLATLKEGWDGYGAAKIDRATINRALAAIEELVPQEAPAPSIVPIHNGGLQIEWHRNQRDLEIEFSPNGAVEFYYFNEITGQELEGPVGSAFANVRDYLGQIW